MFGYNIVANRPYGIFQQPNVMASFLATGLAISGYLLARQPHTKYLHWRHKLVILYAAPVLTIPLLVVLASRTGWLGSILALALLLPLCVSLRCAQSGLYLGRDVNYGTSSG